MAPDENVLKIDASAGDTSALPWQVEGDLKQYARIKMEIAGIVMAATNLAREEKDEENLRRGHRLLARIAEDRFNLAVVGQFNRGKSSLMNAILGSDRLPVGILPLTSIITTVRYGSRERLLVQREGWSMPQEEPLSKLPDYVTSIGNPGNHKQVIIVEVELPAEILRSGFCFIDTPGVGSAVTINTVTTEEFLPDADAVVFVTSFDSPLGEAELGFLRKVREYVWKIFIVVNKADLVSAKEREEILSFVQSCTAQELGTAGFPLFAVSARDGLAAKQNNRPDMLAASGLPELEQSLIDFMTHEKAKEFLLRLTERAQDLLERQRVEMALRISAASDPAIAAARLKEFEEEAQRLRRLRKQLVAHIQRRIAAEMERRFKGDLHAWGRESLAAMSAQIGSLLAGPGSMDWTRRLDETETTIQADAARRVESRLTECRKGFESVLWEIGGEELNRLSDLPDGVLQAAMGVFDLTPSHMSEVLDKSLLKVSRPISFGDVCFEWEIPPKAKLGALPVSWVRKRILCACEQSLARALTFSQGKILELLTEAGIRWTEDLAREVDMRINAKVQRVQQLVNGQVNSDGLNTLERLLRRIAEVKEVPSRWKASGSDLGPDHPLAECSRRTYETLKMEACAICSSALKALLHFLSRRQYELAMNEPAQAAHSENGGFCRLHTWQYAKIASPQGICAAYPRILLTLAQKLRGLASTPKAGLDGDVRMLVAGPGRCPACRVVREKEAAAVKKILAAPGGGGQVDVGELPSLCLSHLAMILESGIDPELARSLLVRQAQILDRVAEDMTNHALKHEALRRSLMTEEEVNAQWRGLTLLAGNANLALPWNDRDRF
jgi:GTP-binding protein EngB required for normal cell division